MHKFVIAAEEQHDMYWVRVSYPVTTKHTQDELKSCIREAHDRFIKRQSDNPDKWIQGEPVELLDTGMSFIDNDMVFCKEGATIRETRFDPSVLQVFTVDEWFDMFEPCGDEQHMGEPE